MLKICILIYNCANYGGVETVASNLVNELSKYYEVNIGSVLDDGRPDLISSDSTIEVTRFVSNGTRLREQQIKLFRPLRAFLKEKRIDVVLTMGHYSAFLAVPVCLVSRARFIFCDHGALVNQWHEKKTTLMRYIASKTSSRVVTLTEKSKRDYIERFHTKPNRITYIYNWIEPSGSDSVRYDSSSHKLLSIGRLSEEKGFDQLIEAMRIVVDHHPDWTLDIYGDGEEEERLKKRIGELKLTENIFLKGRSDSVRDYYKNYSIYVMPSYREGLPLTLLEAKINLLPIVAFDVDTGPREIIRDEEDGLLAEPRNIKDLADKICRLIENDELRAAFSRKAKGNLSSFEKSTIVPKWRKLIEEIQQ